MTIFQALFVEVKHFNVTVDRFMMEGSRLMEQSENGDREMMNSKLQGMKLSDILFSYVL